MDKRFTPLSPRPIHRPIRPSMDGANGMILVIGPHLAISPKPLYNVGRSGCQAICQDFFAARTSGPPLISPETRDPGASRPEARPPCDHALREARSTLTPGPIVEDKATRFI